MSLVLDNVMQLGEPFHHKYPITLNEQLAKAFFFVKSVTNLCTLISDLSSSVVVLSSHSRFLIYNEVQTLLYLYYHFSSF